jgi:hypothetical protein
MGRARAGNWAGTGRKGRAQEKEEKRRRGRLWAGL